MFIDNEAFVKIVKNPIYHSKTKHIDVRIHAIWDAYGKEYILVLLVNTNDQKADIFTKAFDKSKFLDLIQKIGLGSVILKDMLVGSVLKQVNCNSLKKIMTAEKCIPILSRILDDQLLLLCVSIDLKLSSSRSKDHEDGCALYEWCMAFRGHAYQQSFIGRGCPNAIKKGYVTSYVGMIPQDQVCVFYVLFKALPRSSLGFGIHDFSKDLCSFGDHLISSLKAIISDSLHFVCFLHLVKVKKMTRFGSC
ncbi:hypothetical protein L1987_18780 [Smallanthus sonchifolius]|uniref:Uncharacterized protein n=1 Tax=Smallanthus sonchifolius TaxID=185202 RepID=A0ACB9J2W9_9ASTR|nr:hypothetical protein L1987_18780 [Smallanthus sonchifolius]